MIPRRRWVRELLDNYLGNRRNWRRAARRTRRLTSERRSIVASIELSRPWAIRNVGSLCLVELDGRLVGRLPSGKRVVLPVQPGEHILQVRIDTTGHPKLGFMGSPKFRSVLDEQDILKLRVVPGRGIPFFQKNDPDGWLLIEDPDTFSHSKAGGPIHFDNQSIARSISLLALLVFAGIAMFGTTVGDVSWYAFNAIASVSAVVLIYMMFLRHRL